MPAGSASTSLSITNPLVLYRALIATNRIRPDPAQHRLALQLQRLYYRLKDYDPELEYRHRIDQIARSIQQPVEDSVPDQRASPGRLTSLWRRSVDGNALALTRTIPTQESAIKIESPQGMLLYGEVGRGKSMLLDLLYDSLPSRKKRRWHFNTFMLDVFRRLESRRIARMRDPNWKAVDQENSVLSLAKDTITSSPIIFLDEFQLPDRTSSKLLNSFMTGFFHLGGVLVASSNRMPEELAKAAGVEFAGQKDVMGAFFGWTKGRSEGQRAAQSDFGQFLEVLKARCEVWEMEGEHDWRRDYDAALEDGASGVARELDVGDDTGGKYDVASTSTSLETPTRLSSDTPPHYHISFSPSSADYDLATSSWSEEIQTLNPSQSWQPADVHVYGRTIRIPQTSSDPPGIARFSFLALCASNLGPADYITIASTFHTIVLTEVPVLTLLQKNEARRFITLIDALYESKCRLLIQAAAPPDSLFFPETTRLSGSNGGLATKSNETSGSDSVYQETFSEIYQDSLQPFRPNISTYNSSNDSSATPTSNFELRSVLADEDADFGPTYGNGRGQGQSGGEAGLAETLKRQQGQVGPDFSKTNQLTGEDERFAYKRARSRLWEMCGKRWWDDRRGRDVEEWWRPVAREERHWEKKLPANAALGTAGPQAVEGSSNDGSSRPDEGLFKHGASPFRTRSDPPPKLTERHVWGLGLWGPKAGAWGRGEVKGKEKGDGSDPDRSKVALKSKAKGNGSELERSR